MSNFWDITLLVASLIPEPQPCNNATIAQFLENQPAIEGSAETFEGETHALDFKHLGANYYMFLYVKGIRKTLRVDVPAKGGFYKTETTSTGNVQDFESPLSRASLVEVEKNGDQKMEHVVRDVNAMITYQRDRKEAVRLACKKYLGIENDKRN